MAYAYYNQNWYHNVPYPSSANPTATVSSGGCGVCSASMAIENVIGVKKAPPEMAAYAIKNGCRVSGGTDERMLLKALCRDNQGMRMTETTVFDTLVQHLQQGGLAVTSTAGNRSGWTGIFSNAPHIFVVAGVMENGKCEVLDPGYYSGKYNKPGRYGKVTLEGNTALVSQSDLKKEISGRAIYLLSVVPDENKEEDNVLTYEEFRVMMDRYISEREGQDASDWAEEELSRAVSSEITDGKRPQSFVTRQEAAIMALRALEGGRG